MTNLSQVGWSIGGDTPASLPADLSSRDAPKLDQLPLETPTGHLHLDRGALQTSSTRAPAVTRQGTRPAKLLPSANEPTEVDSQNGPIDISTVG